MQVMHCPTSPLPRTALLGVQMPKSVPRCKVQVGKDLCLKSLE